MVGRGPYPLPICWLTPLKGVFQKVQQITDHTVLLARASTFEGINEVIAVGRDLLSLVSGRLLVTVSRELGTPREDTARLVHMVDTPLQ